MNTVLHLPSLSGKARERCGGHTLRTLLHKHVSSWLLARRHNINFVFATMCTARVAVQGNLLVTERSVAVNCKHELV